VSAVLPQGNRLVVGDEADVSFQTEQGRTLAQLSEDYEDVAPLETYWEVTKGQELVDVDANGHVTAIAPGDVTVQAKVKGLAANKGFLFIQALGRIGVTGDDGTIHWDILFMILFFGVSLYINQLLTGQGQATSENSQQNAINKFTPIIFSGMFLFFPLPAGVLMYMLIANVFQTVQTFILSREPLPENLQKIVDAEAAKAPAGKGGDGRQTLPFEPGRAKKKEKAS
jgi:YidC/Oxa1 family membrane protein insertase